MTIGSPKKQDKIPDRFIPTKASVSAYRIVRRPAIDNPYLPIVFPADEMSMIPGVLGLPSLGVDGRRIIGGIRDRSLLNLASTSALDGVTALRPIPTNPFIHAMDDDANGHKSAVADALNLNYNHKVLKFAANDSRGSNGATHGDRSINNDNAGDSSFADSSIPDIHQGLYNDDFGIDILDSSLSTSYDISPKPKLKPVKTKIPCDVLSATNLTKDFYTNLISWSTQTNTIAVGLAHQVCLWSGEEFIMVDATEPPDSITSVGFSNLHFLAIGTRMGKVILYSQTSNTIVDQTVLPATSLSCMEWLPNSLRHFVTGDQYGQVFIFEVNLLESTGLKLLTQVKSQQQQVCGKYWIPFSRNIYTL